MVCAANYRRIASAGFVFKLRTHISVYLELIFIQINIVLLYLVNTGVEMVALNHVLIVNSRSIKNPYLNICTFTHVKDCL